jgi:hypothetical protein
MDEIDGTSRPLLEIPGTPSDRFTVAMMGLLCLGAVPATVGLFYYVGMIELLLRPLPVLLLGLVFVAKCIVPWYRLSRASGRRFLIYKDSLWFRQERGVRGLHFDWDEVSYCHWSHFEAGVLIIQIGGDRSESLVSWPPSRYFYPVPERYQARVETAIRAMGKWAEGEAAPALALAPSEAVDQSASLKAAAVGEVDGPPIPLVEIPRSRRSLLVSLLPVLLLTLFGGLVLLVRLCSNAVGISRAPGVGFFSEFGLTTLAACIMSLTLLQWARQPEFALDEEGVRLPFDQRPTHGSW